MSIASDPLPAAREWLADHGDAAVVVPHHDADGLASGVILATAARGGVLHLGSPWESQVAGGRPAVLADWGVRPIAGPSSVLYVDHHAAPEPVDGVVVHATGDAGPCTSVLAWRVLGEPPELAWLAALGAVGDLGERALRREDVPRAGAGAALRRLAARVSAPGRLREGPVAAAFELLAACDGARAALQHDGMAALEEAHGEVERHRAAALRVAPAVGDRAALISLDVPARVHPQVAVAWARRLSPRVVIAANAGWRPGRVAFAVRSAQEVDLRAWLRDVYEPPAGAGDYARGHARATGGVLVPEAFERFAAAALA